MGPAVQCYSTEDRETWKPKMETQMLCSASGHVNVDDDDIKYISK